MTRTLSGNFVSAAMAQDTDEVLICLLTVAHPELATPIYLSSDPTTRISDDPLIYATVSRTHEHLFLPFEWTFPDDRSDAPPTVKLTIDNIERTLVGILRSFSTPPTILIEVVLASSPDVVEIAVPGLILSDVTIDEHAVSATLVADSLINEPHPAGQFTPGGFPGLF